MNQHAADAQEPVPTGFKVIAVLALIWNLIGVATYLMSVSMTEEALEAIPEAERVLYTDIPAWATAAYAIAVFAGVLGSLGLIVRKAWAVPLLVVSLLGILVQMGHALFLSPVLEIRGLTAAVMPLVLIAIAAYLVAMARSARSKNWIN